MGRKSNADLQAVAASPVAFRAALRIDADNGERTLGSVLDSWQRADFEALDPAWLAVTGRGKPESPKLRCYLERPRGHSKTNDLAVMVSWALFASRRAITIAAAAADQDQARLLLDAVRRLARLNPWLVEFLEVQRDRVVNQHTGSVLIILSADADSSYGITPDAVIVDELTHWSDAGEQLWTSLFSAAAKKRNCLLTIISNAGTGQGQSWQWKIREAARTDESWHFSRLDGPQASWISERHLAEQRRMLPPIAFDRLWLNKWTSGQGDAVQESDLQAAVRLDAKPSQREPGLVYVAGLDLGLSRDASALVVVGVDAEGERMRVVDVQAWKPSPGERVKVEDVEAAVVAAHAQWKLSTVAFDPWQAAYLAERLAGYGIAMTETPFVAKNLQGMASAVVEGFRDQRIELYPEPALLHDLRGLRVVERSFGYRLDATRDKHGHSDRAIALALALLAARSIPRRPTFGILGGDDCGKLPTLAELVGPEFIHDMRDERQWQRVA
jgi:phage terminase large subunit-like protein